MDWSKFVDPIKNWFSGDGEKFLYGVCGLAIGFVVALIVSSVWGHCRRRRDLRDQIVIQDGEQGTYSIRREALQSFVRHLMLPYKHVSLLELVLYEGKAGKEVLLKIGAKEEENIASIRTELRSRLFEEMKGKLGLGDSIVAINFEETQCGNEE